MALAGETGVIPGAEGATTPETLKQKGPQGRLNAGKQGVRTPSPKEQEDLDVLEISQAQGTAGVKSAAPGPSP
jgi:hypothetical protein